MPSRHKAREMAVQMTYQAALKENSNETSLPLRQWSHYWKERAEDSQENYEFYVSTLKGLWAHLPQVDEVLEGALQHWKIERLDRVDLAVLRVAIYELIFAEDTYVADAPVVINEALEISKKFGGKESSVFVNGILDQIAKNRNNTKKD